MELKKKDAEGIGHKFRLVSETGAIKQFIESGKLTHATIEDQLLIDELVKHIADIDISMTKLAKKKKNL